MRRKIYDKLLEWKKNHKGDTALLIEGTFWWTSAR